MRSSKPWTFCSAAEGGGAVLIAVLLVACLLAGFGAGFAARALTGERRGDTRKSAGLDQHEDDLPASPVKPAADTVPGPAPDTAPAAGGAAVAPISFDSAKSMSHVEQLSGAFGPREEGTRGEAAAARSIQDQLAAIGYDFMVALGAGRGLRYRQESGMSDHEAFEKAGVPSVWLEYREPACYHQASDVPSAGTAEHVTAAGALLQEFFES
jgi:hypothetical protein